MAHNLVKLSGILWDLSERIGQNPWRQNLAWLARALALLPYRRIEYTVRVRSLEEPLPTAKSQIPVTLRLATADDLPRLKGLVAASEMAYFYRRSAQGRYCFMALHDEKPAAYCWATTEVELGVDNLKIELQPNDVYIDDTHTIPAYRRKGIQAALQVYCLEYMKNLGCRRAVLIIEEGNNASEQLFGKLGYKELDLLSFRRILWKRNYRFRLGNFRTH